MPSSQSEPVSHPRVWRPVVTFLLAALLVAFVAAIALAGTAHSSWGYYSNNGVDYRARSTVRTDHADNQRGSAATYVDPYDPETVSSGWIGVQARRTSSSGTILCTDSWRHNSGTTGSIETNGRRINNHSAYASKGRTRAWNGSSYSTYVAFLSPSQNS